MKSVAGLILMIVLCGSFFALGCVSGWNQCERSHRQQQAPGPQGEPGRDGKDCDVDELRHEAMGYVNAIEARLDKLKAESVEDQKRLDQMNRELAVVVAKDLSLLSGRVSFTEGDKLHTLRLFEFKDGTKSRWVWEQSRAPGVIVRGKPYPKCEGQR